MQFINQDVPTIPTKITFIAKEILLEFIEYVPCLTTKN